MQASTVRRRVFEYVRKHGPCYAAQIGRALSLSGAAVRHHLRVLRVDGRITEIGTAAKPRRGRPEKMYGLSQAMQGDNLGPLLDLVLSKRLGKLSAAKQQQMMKVLAGAMAELIGGDDVEQPTAARLALALKKLNGSHYQARWEAGPDGPRVMFAHCPYSAVIAQHPELCAMDAALLTILTGQPAEQTAKIGVRESVRCVFRIGSVGARR